MEGPLSLFASLLGHCFVATLSPGTVDRHCFSDVWNGSHVRDVHVVSSNGRQVYAGETIYSFDGKTIQFTYVNSLGGVGHGKTLANGSTIAFTGSMLGSPGAKPTPMDLRWSIGTDSYDVVNAGKPPVRFVRDR